MYITRIEMLDFGKFTKWEMHFEKGMNIIYGKNESGKSTIYAFIQAMLFSMDGKDKDAVYQRFEPWNQIGVYAGILEYKLDGEVYRIYRNFQKGKEQNEITNLNTGRVLSKDEEKQMFRGIDHELCKKLIEFPEDEKIDSKFVEDMLTYCKKQPVDDSEQKKHIKKALDYLDGMKKEVLGQVKGLKKEELLHLREDLSQKAAIVQSKKENYQNKQTRLVQSIAKAKDQEQQLIDEGATNVEDLERYRKYKTEVEKRKEEAGLVLDKYQKNKDKLIENRNIKKNPMEKYQVSNRQEFEDLMESVKKTKVIPTQLIALWILEILELIYAIFGFRQPRVTAVSIAVILVTVVLSAGIITRRLNHKRQFLSDSKKISKTLQEIEFIDKRIGVYNTREEELQDYISQLKDKEEEIKPLEEMMKKKGQLQKVQKSQEKLVLALQKLNAVLLKIKDLEEQIEKEKQEVEHYLSIYENVEMKVKAVEMAKAKIINVSMDMKPTAESKMQKMLDQNVLWMTGGKYHHIILDDKHRIWVVSDKKKVALEKNSAGTIKQVNLAVRLTAATFMLGSAMPPVMLDDIFAHYDDNRIACVIACLCKQFDQTLLFTCHLREKDIADKLKLPYSFYKLK